MPAKSMLDVYDYALSLYGTAYQWGGGHDGVLPTNYGLDCSGFIRKLLSYAHCDPKGDHTADDYYHWLLGQGIVNATGLGSLAFFGTTAKIHHIGFCIDSKVMLSSANGGNHVNTILVAQRLNARVLIEPIHLRKDFVCCIMPLYQLPMGN